MKAKDDVLPCSNLKASSCSETRIKKSTYLLRRGNEDMSIWLNLDELTIVIVYKFVGQRFIHLFAWLHCHWFAPTRSLPYACLSFPLTKYLFMPLLSALLCQLMFKCQTCYFWWGKYQMDQLHSASWTSHCINVEVVELYNILVW